MSAAEQIVAQAIADLPADRRDAALAAIDVRRRRWQPTTDDQLWEAIRDWCGIEIPRVCVCPGHQAPFQFVADAYFERGLPDKLAIGNRGSGKTENVAALHAVNSRTKPDHEGASAGAIESQAGKAYRYFSGFTRRPGWEEVVDPRQVNLGRTEFRNGAIVAIVIATLPGVNSPHPNVAHLDEIELLRPGIYQEALNMAQSGNGYRGQNLLTSSWKLPRGLISQIKAEVAEAMREGVQASHDLYHWCVYETTQQCPHDCNACPFADVVRGRRQTGTDEAGRPVTVPRTFEWTCKRGSPQAGVGKLKFSRGFASMDDAVRRFRSLSARMWESQQESRKPTAEGLVYDNFDEAQLCVEGWEPWPEYGDVVAGADFGGTNPFAVGFWQRLRAGVMLDGRLIPEGSWVLFDEVYTTETSGNVEVGRAVNDRIGYWASQYPGFAVERIWRDPAAKAAAVDWGRLDSYGAGAALRTRRTGGARVEDRIGVVYDLIDDEKLYVDSERCPHFLDEIGGYEADPISGKPVKENDHHMDAMGYVMYGEFRLAGNKPTSGVAVAPSDVRNGGSPARTRSGAYDPASARVGESLPVRYTRRIRDTGM